MNVSVVLFTSFVFLLIMGVPVAASLTFASFIYLFGFTVDTLDISLRLDVRFSHLQRNKTSG